MSHPHLPSAMPRRDFCYMQRRVDDVGGSGPVGGVREEVGEAEDRHADRADAREGRVLRRHLLVRFGKRVRLRRFGAASESESSVSELDLSSKLLPSCNRPFLDASKARLPALVMSALKRGREVPFGDGVERVKPTVARWGPK